MEAKELEESLAEIFQELEQLRHGLRLLGVEHCGYCRRYFRSEGESALFEASQLASFGCLPKWWLQYSPTLGNEERKSIEHQLVRWLVAHHSAKVIRIAKKLPQVDQLEFKIVVGCDQCNGTGEASPVANATIAKVARSIWVVGLKPKFQ